MNIIGDVAGRACILVDDIVDSGGTLCNAAEALLEAGRDLGRRLYHPRRALRRRGRAHHRLQADRARHHRLDRGDERGALGAQHPHRLDRPLLGEAVKPHGAGKVGVEPLRLSTQAKSLIASPASAAQRKHRRAAPT